jgi:micrococcal nuclease
MRKKRSRGKNALRFDIVSNERGPSSKGSPLVLIGVAALFCGALLFSFGSDDQTQPLGSADGAGAAASITQHASAELGSEASSGEIAPALASTAQGHEFTGQFQTCGRERITCVVDGDTIWLNGQKIRIADIDTPEVSHPKCRQELVLGIAATQRLVELLNQGSFSVIKAGDRDEDRYGRKLRIIVRGNSSIGDQLVREGLAHSWVGHKKPWC